MVGAYGQKASRKHGVGIMMPWNSVSGGMAQLGPTLPAAVTTDFANMLVVIGLARWSTRLAMGPLPVVCAAMMKPMNASIA